MGTDGSSHHYRGDSQVISPQGEIIATAGPHQATYIDAGLSPLTLHEYREKFPAWQDTNPFTLQLSPSLLLRYISCDEIASLHNQSQNKFVWRHTADIVFCKE